jgi:hypothetical protein
MVIVVVLPLPYLLVEEVDVVGDAVLVQELVKLLVVDAMRSLHLAVQTRRSWADVDVLDVEALEVPVEVGLKLRAIAGLDDVHSKG